MPTRPTLSELVERVKSDFETYLEDSDAHLRRNTEFILACVEAGLAHDMYGYLYGYIIRQIFPDTADELNFWKWAAIWGLERKAAVYWRGTYRFTGTDTTSIPEGTTIERSDGETFTTGADAAIDGTYIDVSITASVPGADGQCDDGQTLSLSSPIAGIDADGTVQDTTKDGADAETREEGVDRLLQRIRQAPSGGGSGDYVRWALEVSGVTRAWEFPQQSGLGTVSVAFVRDNDTPITPDLTERNEVLDYITEEDAGRAPVTADVSIIDLSTSAIDVTLTALSPNTAAVQDAVEESLAEMIDREAEPGGTISLSKFDEAISLATGEESHTMSIPASDPTAAISQIFVLGTVTFP